MAYAIVTGLLVELYAGLVLPASRVLSFHTPTAEATFTVAAAALFKPPRRRVGRQLKVDRRFNRAWYNADQTVTAFATRRNDITGPGFVCDDRATSCTQALEPAHVSV